MHVGCEQLSALCSALHINSYFCSTSWTCMHVCMSSQLQLLVVGGCVSVMLFLAQWLLFAHVPVCGRRPPSLDLFPVHVPTSIFETPLRVLSPENLIHSKSAQHRPLASITCTLALTRKMKREATRTEARAAWRRWCKQLAFLLTAAILSLADIVAWFVERCRSGKRSRQLLLFLCVCPTSYLERVYKKEPIDVHYPPSTLGEAIRKLSFCSR